MKTLKFYYNRCSNLDFLIDLECVEIERVFDRSQADVVLLMFDEWNNLELGCNKNKIIVVADLWPGGEGFKPEWYEQIARDFLLRYDQGNLLILSQYHSCPESVLCSNRTHIRKYDMMFNLVKAYFSQLPIKKHFFNEEFSWLWSGNRSYDLDHWARSSEHRARIFLSANRPYGSRTWSVRPAINGLLESYSNLGYISKYKSSADTVTNSDIGLHSRREDPLVNGALEFDVHTGKITDRSSYYTPIGDRQRGFSPIHINYYENTFISIYGETLEYGDTVLITEKTFNPLMHGHFILPFGSCHTIKAVRDMGFKLPEFIDYSYDEIKNDLERKNAFINEIQRLLDYPVGWWAEKRDQNLDLLFRNRRLCWDKPYDQFMPFVKELS